jgi:hypothetical protein
MKKVDVIVEGKKEIEIKVEDKDLEALLKVIKVFESGKINL